MPTSPISQSWRRAGDCGHRARDGRGVASAASLNRRRKLWFFFQAEDGIRDIGVTGVQTCALPILEVRPSDDGRRPGAEVARAGRGGPVLLPVCPGGVGRTRGTTGRGAGGAVRLRVTGPAGVPPGGAGILRAGARKRGGPALHPTASACLTSRVGAAGELDRVAPRWLPEGRRPRTSSHRSTVPSATPWSPALRTAGGPHQDPGAGPGG